MNRASEALADVRGWLCEHLDASSAGKVCGMLSEVSCRIGAVDRLAWDMYQTLVREDRPYRLYDLREKIEEYKARMKELGIDVDQ